MANLHRRRCHSSGLLRDYYQERKLKWGKTRRGTAIISVGGIRWSGYKAKKPIRISWDELQDFAEQ